MRDELGHGVSLTSDLYVDDAGIIALSSKHVRALCARRTEAALDALCDAGVEVHADKKHSDELDSTVWGAAFYRNLVSAERGRLCEMDVLT